MLLYSLCSKLLLGAVSQTQRRNFILFVGTDSISVRNLDKTKSGGYRIHPYEQNLYFVRRFIMEIKYVLKNEITISQQNMLKIIKQTCFGIDIETIINDKEKGHPFGAVELGVFLLFDEDIIVGCVYVYKRLTEYDGQEYYIGGLGGLAVMPEYQGKGYARQLSEKALKMCYDIGVDVACLFMNKEESISQFYEKLGYVFLDRECYYFDSLCNESFFDNVMILGLNNKDMAEKILATNHKFHYGIEEGCW